MIFKLFLRLALVTLHVNSAPLEIFIIPHTHDDVGWTSTVDQYYVHQVQFILDSVIEALADNPARKFTYVEMGFFSRWWNQQTDTKKAQVQQLVDNKQLTFNLGGWTMNDEACTHYDREINQMTEGHQFLLKNLGVNARPTVGWHIDPFGHSSATASLWADVGFNAFGLNRIDYRLKDALKANKSLEFIWRGSSSLGQSNQIWAHVMDSHYGSPGSITFDEEEGGKTINNDPTLPTYGVDVGQTAIDFINDCRNRATWYKHNNLLIPFGNDFTHKNCDRSLKELDILIDYINNNNTFNAHVQYAHFEDYVAAVNALNLTWDVFTDDFFPYASGANSYWTGYYASHNQFKGYARSQTGILRQTEVLNTFANQGIVPKALHQNLSLANTLEFADTQSNLAYARQALSSATHHDGITGTEKSFVVDDYTTQIETGTGYVQSSLESLGGQLLSSTAPPALTVDSSIIQQASGSNIIAVVVHNSVAWARREFVAVPVNRTDLSVVDTTGAAVPAQIDAVSSYSATKTSNYMLYFLASLPALGFNTYYVQQKALDDVDIPIGEPNADTTISNDFYSVSFDSSGRLDKIVNKVTGQSSTLRHDLFQYRSADSSQGQASGAYVFRPATSNYLDIGTDGSNSTIQKTVNFSPAYSSNPIVIIGPQGSNYNDTFATALRTLSTTSMQVNTFRVDGTNGWGQDLHDDYIVFAQGAQPMAGWSGFQSGTVSIGTSTACKTASITFTKAFSSTPKLLLTPLLGGDYDDTLLATTLSISTTQASVTICRVNGYPQGWGVSASLLWTAWDSTAVISQGYSGNIKVGASNGANIVLVTVNVAGASLSGLTGFIGSTHSAADAFAYTVQSIGSTSVLLQVRKIDNTAWTDSSVSLDWLIFTRQTLDEYVIDSTSTVSTKVISGPYVNTIEQTWRSGYTQTVRLFQDGSGNSKNQADLNFIDVTNDVGVIDDGWELVTRWNTDIPSNGNFNGDGNGLERRPRVYDPTKTEPIAGNFYPAVHSASLSGQSSGQDIQFTIVTDRTHSVSSLSSGSIELMLMRRCIDDDGYGVGEVLDETDPIAPHFRIFLDSTETSTLLRHKNQIYENYPPSVLFGTTSSIANWNKYVTNWSALSAPLPANIHLLTLELRNPTTSLAIQKQISPFKRPKFLSQSPTQVDTAASDPFILFRLQHLFESGESTQYSTPVTVDLTTLFNSNVFTITTIQEMSLTAIYSKTSLMAKRLNWFTVDDSNALVPTLEKTDKLHEDGTLADITVTLNPRQIKTYRVNSPPVV